MNVKNTILSTMMAMFSAVILSAQGIPSLQMVHGKSILVQDGKPLILLSGELHNSTASSVSYMEKDRTFDNLKALGLNSVIASASWELVEPSEGTYDFSQIDYVVKAARERNMKVVFIWFGAFKNPFMTYAPSWVKKDPKRFPRARDERGRELSGEFHRWFDLKRTKTLYTRVPKYNTRVKKAGELEQDASVGKYLLRPIPDNEIQRVTNPDFKQNPGYLI